MEQKDMIPEKEADQSNAPKSGNDHPPPAIGQRNTPRTWFFTTVVIGSFPIWLRLVVWVGSTCYPIVDIKDFIYFGIAVNLSNMAIIQYAGFNDAEGRRQEAIALSCTLGFALGILMYIESRNLNDKLELVLGIISYLILIWSLILNLAINKRIWNQPKQ